MRPLALLLALGVAFLMWQRGWLGAAIPGAGATKGNSSLEDRITNHLETERLRLVVPALAPDPEVAKWLLETVKSGARDPSAIAQKAREVWPQYQDVRVLQTQSILTQGILDHITAWSDAGARDLTHHCIVTERGVCGIGWHVTMLVGQRFPDFSPEALDDPKQSKFYTTCTLCRHGQASEIPRHSRCFKLRCHHCGLHYAMLAADSQGRFRPVTEFLTGYAPPAQYPEGQSKLAELMDIWRVETQRCRYLTDGGNDDDDAWQTAEETLELRQGDCEDSAILLADWLSARNFEARVAIGTYEGARGAHAWVVVRLEGHDFVLESTEFPFNLQRPPLLSEVGSRYVPELLFDRQAIFVPKSPDTLRKGDLWSGEHWHRITTTRQTPAPSSTQAQ